MKPIYTIGIDPGLLNVGLSAVEHRGPVPLIYHGHAVTTGGLKGNERFDYIYSEVGKFIDKFPTASVVCLEGYDYLGFRLVDMAEISGILKLLCHQKGRKVVSVSPSSLKKFATGNSSAGKFQIMSTYDQTNEHIADACALAEVALMYSGARTSTKRYKLEVIKQLHNPVKKTRSKNKQKGKLSKLHSDFLT